MSVWERQKGAVGRVLASEGPEAAKEAMQHFGWGQEEAQRFMQEEGMDQQGQQQQEGSLAVATFKKIVNLASSVGMIDDHRVKGALKIIHMDPEDEQTIAEVYREVMDFLEPEYEIAQMAKSAFEPLPPEQFAEGEIKLGFVDDDRVGKAIGPHDSWPAVIFGLSFKEINEHTLILGRSGAGKTSLITNMVLQLMQYGVKCWIIDMQKDYRGLMNVLPDDVLVIPWKMFRFNPLRPPAGVASNDWVSDFSDILCEALVAYRGAKNILQRNIAELFSTEEFDVENTNIYPTLHDLLDKLQQSYAKTRKKAGYRELQHLDTAASIVEMTARGLHDVVDCDEGHPMDALLEKNVVFELSGLGGELKTVFVNLLFGWIIAHRVATGQKEGWWQSDEQTHNLRNVLVFDEAKTVFDIEKEKKRGSTIPYVMQAVTTLRKYGVGLIVSDQMWNMLAQSITANVNTKIALSSHPQGLMDMVRYLGLEGEEQIKSFQNQPAMHAVVKLSDRWPHPFPIKFERFHYDPEVTDFEIKIKSGKALSDLGWKPAKKPVFEAPETEHEEVKAEPTVEDFRYSDAGRVLDDICDHPFSPVTDRYARLNLSAEKGNSTVEHLKRNELVKKAYVDFGRGGGKVALLSMTDKGCDVINRKPKVPGKGSIEHRYCQHRVFEIYKAQGYICEFEAKHSDEGESIDILARKDNEAIGIEIELGTDINQPIQNVRKCLNHGCTKVVVISKTTLRNKLKKELPHYFSDDKAGKVELKLFSFLAPGTEEKQQDAKVTPSEPPQAVETERETVTEEIALEPEAPPFEMPEAGKVKVYLGHDRSKKGKEGWVFWEPLVDKPKKIPNPHIMILGTSGSGKTQTLKALIYELHQQNVPAVIFDFHGEYAEDGFNKAFDAKVIDPLKGVNINPLELPTDPGTGNKASPVQLVSEVTEIIDGIYRLGHQQKALLRKAIYHALEEAGISKKDPDTWNRTSPGFDTLDTSLNHYEALGDPVASKLRSKLGELFETELFSVKKPLPIDLLLKGVTVLNLQSLHWDSKLQVTLSRFFLKKIYNEMLKRKETKGIRMFCVIDEAHKVTSDPIIEDLVREARKYGLGLILASHMPKDFHEAVFSNTATKIVLKLEKEDHAREIIKHLGTFSRKEKEMLRTEILSQDTLDAFVVNNHHQPYVKIKLRPYYDRVKKKEKP